jgi:AraC-like DNA-binding protein
MPGLTSPPCRSVPPVLETRRELAQQYLRRPRHSLRHVADMLGFEDQGNLFRACKRWFGESPATYRARFSGGAERTARS